MTVDNKVINYVFVFLTYLSVLVVKYKSRRLKIKNDGGQ
jgi:hypothetical protein